MDKLVEGELIMMFRFLLILYLIFYIGISPIQTKSKNGKVTSKILKLIKTKNFNGLTRYLNKYVTIHFLNANEWIDYNKTEMNNFFFDTQRAREIMKNEKSVRIEKRFYSKYRSFFDLVSNKRTIITVCEDNCNDSVFNKKKVISFQYQSSCNRFIFYVQIERGVKLVIFI